MKLNSQVLLLAEKLQLNITLHNEIKNAVCQGASVSPGASVGLVSNSPIIVCMKQGISGLLQYHIVLVLSSFIHTSVKPGK